MPKATTTAPRFLTAREFLEAIQEATGRPWSKSALYRAIERCALPATRLGGTILIDRMLAEAQLGVKLRVKRTEK